MASHFPIEDSFFDDDIRIRFTFTAPKASHQEDIMIPPTIASTLTVFREATSDELTQSNGIYALHNDLLVAYDSNMPSVPRKVLYLTHSRLSILDPDEAPLKFGFRVTKNGFSLDFFAANKQFFDSWVNALRSICVLSTYQEDYKILKTLGKGGFATVTLVENKHDKTLYAAKSFTKKSFVATIKEKAKPSLLNEINVMRGLNHDNIVKLYEVHETEKSVYLVMELIKGKTMHDLLKKNHKGLPEGKVREMMYSLLHAVSYMASQGLMHRDLKPANILVGKDDVIKIADFGLATQVQGNNMIFHKCGTPGFMAPEVFRFNEKNFSSVYDEKCDVFGIGCIFYSLVFNQPFFKGNSPTDVIFYNKNFSMNYEGIANIVNELQDPAGKLDKEALSLLLELLDANPKKRISAAKALEHTYFSPLMKTRDVNSAGEPQDSMQFKNINTDLLSPFHGPNSQKLGFSSHEDSPESFSFVAAIPHRFTHKESFYLDMGGSPSNSNSIESYSNSTINSPKLGRNDSVGSNLNSPSSFSNHRALQRGPSFGKSPRGSATGTPVIRGSQFLKAAIFNNMHKQNEPEDDEPRCRVPATKIGRLSVESGMMRMREQKRLEEPSLLNESSEVRDGGNENAQIQRKFDHILSLTKEKRPSYLAHVI